jgi:hypothetical protein
MLIPGFFDAFDENRDGIEKFIFKKTNWLISLDCVGCIDFTEFVCGISASCRGPQFERYKCTLLWTVSHIPPFGDVDISAGEAHL